MSKLGYKKMQRKQRCDTYGCRNLAEYYIGKDKTNIYEHKRLCMECLGEYARIWDEVKPQELPFADIQDENGYMGVPDAKNPENMPPSEQSKSEKTDNPSSDKTLIEGVIVENQDVGIKVAMNEEIPTNFMALKKFAKEKGMDVTNDTKKEEITAYLAEHGIG